MALPYEIVNGEIRRPKDFEEVIVYWRYHDESDEELNPELLAIKRVEIPEGTKQIGPNTFSSCQNLTSITIPNSVTTIGDSAFSGCRSLTSIVIPESVTSIGSNAFGWCKSLKSITIPRKLESAVKNCRSMREIKFSDK